MRYFKSAVYILCAASAVSLLAGCASDGDIASPESGSFAAGVFRRMAGNVMSAPDDELQLTRLYLAQRMQEHDFLHDPLHCGIEDRYTLTGGEYRIENLYGQWYKFAFVCVPEWDNGGGENLLSEEDPKERTCDYNKLLIDFNDVMDYQQANVNVAASRDVNIYRRVLDRWIDPDEENMEDVEMTRITGELFLDMGIPADQFEHPLKFVSITLEAPESRVYIRDESRDEVIPAPGSDQADRVYTLDFSALGEEEYALAMKQRQSLRICMLPQVLHGGITVAFKGNASAIYIPIGEDRDNGDIPLEVRKNRITTVLYNGMEKNEFEVRYAGFDAGNDSAVDVDEDVWDGWQDL